MTDSNPNCEYHPDRDAITKCETCGKLICVECKNIFQQQHSRSSSHGFGSDSHTHTSYYYTRHELCTPCFYERKIKVVQSPFNYCIIIFGVIFTAVAILMTSFFLNFAAMWGGPAAFSPAPFVFVPIIFILIGIGMIIAGIRSRLTAPQKAEAFKVKREEFFKNLSGTPSTSQASADYDPSQYVSCPYCGDKVDIGEKICDKCGSDMP